jgi:hypothetical protein
VNIEQTVSSAMNELALGSAFTFDDLVKGMQRRRHRRLRIVELADLDLRDGVCALWFGTESEDVVVHMHSDSVLHRRQFVLHEFAHMLLDHGDDQELVHEDFLLPDIPPETVRRLLARHDLNSENEIAAESLADHLAGAIRGSVFAESRYLEIFG